METTPIKQDFISSELKRFETDFEITEDGLIALRDAFKDLTIAGQEDKAGLKTVENARKALKSQRVKIKKASENLRESAVKFQKAVIEREKTLVALIEPTEDILSGLEDDYYAEKERLRLEEEKKESDRIQAMIDQLNEVDYAIDYHTLKGLTDEQFATTLQEATRLYNIEVDKAFEAEKARIQAAIDAENERKAQEAERKKFEEEQAAFRAEQKKIEQANAEAAAKLKAEQDKLQAEKMAIERAKEAERQEKIRLANLEQAKKEAAENARIEAEAKAKKAAEDKLEAERKAKEEAEEALLAGSDKVKFQFVEQALYEHLLADNVLIWTHFKSKKGKAAADKVLTYLKEARKICIDNIK